MEGVFIEGNIQQCYGVLPENFNAFETFAVSYFCGQAFSVLIFRNSKFCFRFEDENKATLHICPSGVKADVHTFRNWPDTQTQKFH